MENSESSAFPQRAGVYTKHGLTKREYFAAMAMQGLIANCYFQSGINDESHCIKAISIADELLSQLSNKQEEKE